MQFMTAGKTILITRSHDDAHELRDALQSLGNRVLHEPLTEMLLNHTARIPLAQLMAEDPDAVLLTSRHGVRALAILTDARDLSLLCVGDATAEVAESLGFVRVFITGRTSEDMANYILDAYDQDAKLIYVSAAHARPEMQETLGHFGYQLQRIMAYEAVAAESLSDTLIEQIRREQIDAVTLMSERTSSLWISLLEKAGILNQALPIVAYCISEQAAEPLRDAGWKKIVIANEPTLASLIQCVDNGPA